MFYVTFYDLTENCSSVLKIKQTGIVNKTNRLVDCYKLTHKTVLHNTIAINLSSIIMNTNKFNKLNIKNFIKGTNNPSRLQSIRLPRDLNLGGTKTQPKKVYKPNLNVIRNKNKLEKSKNVEKAKSKSLRERSQNLKDRFVQSTGVFSEGTGSNIDTAKKTDRKLNWKNAKPSEKLQSSYLAKHSIKTTLTQLNEAVTNNIKNDKSDSDSEENVPFAPSTWNRHQESLEVKSETKTWSNHLPPEYTYTPDNKANPIITLWQMPDSFSCKGEKIGDFHLQDMPEGQIGKITVHKSGKFEVSIANSKLLLDSMLDSFSEEVVCFNNNRKNSLVLGELTSRFVLSPDWSICL